MKVEQILKISAKECFDTIELSVKEDIKASTGKNVRKLEKGFKYTKPSSKDKDKKLKIVIKEFIRNSKYTSVVDMDNVKVEMCYEITDLKDGTCKVTYTENRIRKDGYEVKGLRKKYVDYKVKSNAEKTINSIERYVLGKREQ